MDGPVCICKFIRTHLQAKSICCYLCTSCIKQGFLASMSLYSVGIGRSQLTRFSFGLIVLCRLLTSTFLLAHLMAQDLIRQAPAMLMRVQSMPAGPRSPSKRPPDAARDSSSPGRALGSSLRGSALAPIIRQHS